MSVIIKLFTIPIVLFLTTMNLQASPVKQSGILTILESELILPKGDSPGFQMELKEKKNGIEISCFVETKAKAKTSVSDLLIEPGGNFLLSLDDIVIFQQFISGTTLTMSNIMPFSEIPDGTHTLRCEIRTSMGRMYEQKVSFRLNTSPSLKAGIVKDKSELVNAEIVVGFIDKVSETAGYLTIYIDERFMAVVPISQVDNNKKISLSKLLKKQNPITMLPQGNHLLRLMAQGINGSKTIQYVAFTVDTIPYLKVNRGQDGKLNEIKAYFFQAPEGFSGTLDIYYQQGVIFSKRSQGKQLSVTRQDIISALEMNKFPIPTEATSFVLSARSVNGAEYWQEVVFY